MLDYKIENKMWRTVMKRILGYIKKVNKARLIKIFLIIVIVIAIGILLPHKIKQIQDNKKYK